MTVEDIARVCHEVNRAYCLALGDTSQPDWEDAPEWQRESSVNHVLEVQRNPDSPPSRTHEHWLKDKLAAGWVWGIGKDQALKTHPCIVPYDDLPVDQKAKDYISAAVVRALL